jgi:hypothetical protein
VDEGITVIESFRWKDGGIGEGLDSVLEGPRDEWSD